MTVIASGLDSEYIELIVVAETHNVDQLSVFKLVIKVSHKPSRLLKKSPLFG